MWQTCAELRKHRKPKWAVQFREPDSRLLQLTNLEFRLISPVVPIVSILRLPGEGQSATTDGSINFHNDAPSEIEELGVAVRGAGRQARRRPERDAQCATLSITEVHKTLTTALPRARR